MPSASAAAGEQDMLRQQRRHAGERVGKGAHAPQLRSRSACARGTATSACAAVTAAAR